MNHFLILLALVMAPMANAGDDKAAVDPQAESTEPTETANTEGAAPATDDATASPNEDVVELPIDRVTVKRRVQPTWPVTETGKKGTVCEVTLYVDTTGKPTRAVSVCGLSQFEKSATAAAMKWRFEPYMVDGKPTRFKWKLQLRFTYR